MPDNLGDNPLDPRLALDADAAAGLRRLVIEAIASRSRSDSAGNNECPGRAIAFLPPTAPLGTYYQAELRGRQYC